MGVHTYSPFSFFTQMTVLVFLDMSLKGERRTGFGSGKSLLGLQGQNMHFANI